MNGSAAVEIHPLQKVIARTVGTAPFVKGPSSRTFSCTVIKIELTPTTFCRIGA